VLRLEPDLAIASRALPGLSPTQVHRNVSE